MTIIKSIAQVDYYENVRQKLKLGPLYAANHKKIIELMKIFWNETEIELLSHFNSADDFISLKQLSERTKLPKLEVKQILERSLTNGTISKVGSKYCLIPLVPGIFESYFIKRSDTEENLLDAAKIYRFLFKNILPQAWLESNFILFRPLLPFEAEEKLISINKELDVKQEVLSYELVRELIDKNELFSVVPCQCRLIGELTSEPCEVASSELGCFLTGTVAQTAINGGAPQLTKEEAIDFLRKTEKAGLVHSCIADTSVESSLFICNCCSCHCGILATSKEVRHNSIIPSNYAPKFDNDLCMKCDTCLKKCPMDAILHIWPEKTDKSDEHMLLKEEYCIGCGVCAVNCPNNAIKLVKVRNTVYKDKHKIGNKSFLQLLL